MAKSFKTLLHVVPYELTASEIGEIKKIEREENRFHETILPEYCLHTETGEIRNTRDYLQWIENGDEKFLLFSATTIDDLLMEEINNSSLEDLLGKSDLRVFFNNLKKYSVKSLTHRGLHAGQYLVITLCYIGGDMWNPDWDMDVYIDGVLTSDLKLLEPIVQ